MSRPLHFLIIDGYSRASRDGLEAAGMTLAWALYVQMLEQHLPGASDDVLLPSDPGTEMPDESGLAAYDAIIWTGCDLVINELDHPSVAAQIELAKLAYRVGTPSFGSCWGVQMAAVAAGGEVRPHPQGREMGLARKVWLTPEGAAHPMLRGKPNVFEPFISHDDQVTRLPEGATLLASNEYTRVQALEVKHQKGTFWATQYHPEYDLHEMACLIIARTEKLIRFGFYRDEKDLQQHVEKMKALHAEPGRKDLRWQLAIDDDILDDRIRQAEFANWLNELVIPSAEERRS
jgi:GMP synthase (glutamine-hydrolysing)